MIGRKTLWKRFKKQGALQVFVLAGMLYLVVFNLVPMFGLLMGFKDYSISSGIKGIFTSEWVGLKYFKEFVTEYKFGRLVRNTVALSILKLIFTFPLPILFALMVNEIRNLKFKKLLQTCSYLPHFISWTVFGGIVLLMTDMNIGIINPILELLGLSTPENPVDLNLAQYFYPKIIIASVIKSTGWGSIIYIAAIAGIDQSLYEAAKIDGAGRFRQAISITLPEIRPTILVYLLLNISTLLSNSFEQFYVFQNVANLSRTRVLATYMYNLGFTYRKYSTATALSLCEGALSLFLLMSTNWLAKKFTGEGILY